MIQLANIPFIGEIASLLAAMTWGVTINIHTHYSKKFPAHTLNLYRVTIGACSLLAATFVFRFPWPEDSHASVLLLASGALGIAVGDLFLFSAMRRIGASLSSVIQVTSPLFATLFGFLFLDEKLTRNEICGIVLVTSSLACLLWQKRKENLRSESHNDGAMAVGASFAFATAILTAASYAIVHYALPNIHPVTATAIRMSGGFIAMLFLSQNIFGGPGVRSVGKILQNTEARASLLTAALLSTCLGFVFATIGLKYAAVGVSSALQKTHPLFVMPIARLFRNERVGKNAFLLSCFAIIGIILMFL